MKARAFVLGLAVAVCALPLLAQDIPAGDDVWDSVGGGATETTLSPEQWRKLCGASVAVDTSVLLKGFNIDGLGTGDTVVKRLEDAILPGVGSSATVDIQLQQLSMISEGSHPCSPKTLRVTQDGTQAIGEMTITKTSSAGGTFLAKVPVTAVIKTTDGSGEPVYVDGVLGDDSASPWSYNPPTEAAAYAAAAAAPPWHPSVDPVTKKPVKTCRRGNKILPARHCYQPRPPCKTVVKGQPVDSAVAGATVVPVLVEKCTVDATPVGN
jgi:hypothetical protein